MAEKIRWGILGTGVIAKKFAQGLAVLDDATLSAVGSRTPAGAASFAAEFKVPRQHGSYAELAADPEVDIIYVATPHPMHVGDTLLCLDNGKAVICEKPFAVNAAEARRMARRAREKKLFLMEAMWTRYIPAVVQAKKWVDDGEIGDVRMIIADFGFRASCDEEHRLLNPALGGGGLLDVGIYPISFASMIFGQAPDRIAGLADLCSTGVDEQAAYVLGYGPGRMAILASAVCTETPQHAVILGEKGAVHVHAPFWRATKATLKLTDKADRFVELPLAGNGYNYEAAEAMRCLRAGELESPAMPLDESIQLMETMDRIREQWGMRYPMDKA